MLKYLVIQAIWLPDFKILQNEEEIKVIRRIYFILLMSMFAIFSLVNVSGLGQDLNTDAALRMAIYFFTIFNFFIAQKKTSKITNTPRILFVLLVILIFEGSSTLGGHTGSGIIYLSFFICIYLISLQEFKTEYLTYTAIIYSVFGVGILLILKYTTILHGWNPNSMAIICFQSYMIFFATLKTNNSIVRFIFYLLTIIYISLLSMSDSRSAMICIVFAVLICLKTDYLVKVLNKKGLLIVFLIIPLVIALSVIILSNFEVVDILDQWSIDTFSKGIFNGRDIIWLDGFKQFAQKPLLGHGYINSGYWHNSAVACLYSYGLVGYIIYITLFYKILNSGADYLEDEIVRKSILAFLILNFQQSFENTLFVAGGIYLPYVLLGVFV